MQIKCKLIKSVQGFFFSPLLSFEECCKQFHLSYLVQIDAPLLALMEKSEAFT